MKKTTNNISQDSRSPARDVNQRFPEYEAGRSTRPRHLDAAWKHEGMQATLHTVQYGHGKLEHEWLQATVHTVQYGHGKLEHEGLQATVHTVQYGHGKLEHDGCWLHCVVYSTDAVNCNTRGCRS
jgi:hypothetical protein